VVHLKGFSPSLKVDSSCIPPPSHTSMLQTLGAMSTNSMKNNIALIIFQCCPIATCYNATTCAIIRCKAIVKKKMPLISCACTPKIKIKKPMKERKKREKTKG
jgi:hypothetical protein